MRRAWFVAAITMGALVAAAGFRSSTGALLEPLEEDSAGTAPRPAARSRLNLVLYGVTAPFAAALMERFGIRRVVAASLTLVAHRLRPDVGDDRGVAAVAALGARGRRGSRGDRPGLRGDQREPLVRRSTEAW